MNYIKNTLLTLLVFSLLFSSNVNFLIDTDDDYGAVWITGTFDGWTGWGLELINIDNIWTGSMVLPNGDYQYVILGVDTDIPNWWDDIWGSSTMLGAPLGSECDFIPSDEWQNYGFTINNFDITQEYCAGTCNVNCGEFNGYPITFTVDMSEQEIESGDGPYPAVFLVGSDEQLNGPAGLEMNDIGNGLWEITTNLMSGTYTYKFRNGFYDYWDSPGWENITGYCSVGEFNDRQIFVNENTQAVGPFCFGSCETCNPGTEQYILVWNDEFDDEQIDQNKWTFEVGNGDWGWGNGEHQYYTNRDENAFIENGNLVIQALYENFAGFNYTSARMKTINQGDWKYGKVKARIKVPSAGGTWPAFWMMPTNSVYGGWPHSGEIDIMEHYGCNPNHLAATIHNHIYNWNGGIPPTSYEEYIPTATSEFHDYELEWTENELKFYFDGLWVGSYYNIGTGWEQWPFDQEFYIILNLAIGSHFMPCETEDNLFPQRYEIDYVRVYQLQEILYGDVNFDGELNVNDIVIVIGFIIQLTIPSELEFSVSDMNQDNALDILDIVLLVSEIL